MNMNINFDKIIAVLFLIATAIVFFIDSEKSITLAIVSLVFTQFDAMQNKIDIDQTIYPEKGEHRERTYTRQGQNNKE